MNELLAIVRRLRDPDTGCPWDLEQTFSSIAPYTVEEAYEVMDAVEKNDVEGLKGELGDLLFHVALYAQMAEEKGLFDFNDVVEGVAHKMRCRHTHVFEPNAVKTKEELNAAWEDKKALERAEKDAHAGVLDDVAAALPALKRAQKLQKRAARVGFDWPELEPVLDKLDEEIDELKEALSEKQGDERIQEELGDVLFSVVNLSRHLGGDAEGALRGTNAKFERRFRFIENLLAKKGRTVEQADLDELETYWLKAKAAVG